MSNGTVVELHVTDFEPIKKYYGSMGFELVWERAPEEAKGYLAYRMGANVLCFWAGNDRARRQGYFKRFPADTPPGYAVEIIIMVEDVAGYYEKVKDIANVVKPLVERPWGARDFRVVDPAGFYLRFSESYDVLDPSFSVP